MTLGYDGKLYILAFDHRGSFQKKMFGIEGDPTPEETDTIADAKHLIFEGLLQGRRGGRRPGMPPAASWTSSSAADIPSQAKEQGLVLAMPVEKSGQNEFDFDYGDEFGDHIEQFDPDFAKVLVRYNPDGRRGDEPAPVGAAQAPRGLAARERPQVPLRAARAGRGRPARAGRRRHGPLRRRAAPGADAPRRSTSSRRPASRPTSGRSRASTRRRTASGSPRPAAATAATA